MTEVKYEAKDLEQARAVILSGYLKDITGRTLDMSDLEALAEQYYHLRLQSYNPATGTHY